MVEKAARLSRAQAIAAAANDGDAELPAPLFWLLIGPNGSGKTTYHQTRIAPRLCMPFINADHLALQKLGSHAPENSYRAAQMAELERQRCLGEGRSFVAETVFSHPSKLALIGQARDSGFTVWVSLVCTSDVGINLARVAHRVDEGGHDVPAQKVVERYHRMLPLARQAVLAADLGLVLDNSRMDKPLMDILRFANGRLLWKAPRLPAWAKNLFLP